MDGFFNFLIGATLVVGAVVLVPGVVFTGNDVATAAENKPSGDGWYIGEAIYGVPVGLGLDIYAGYSGHTKGGGAGTTVATALGMWTNTLLVHGVWAKSADVVHPRPQLGLSAAIGANFALTSAALGVLTGGSRNTVPFGVLQIVGTAPTVVVGIRALADREVGDKPAWAALTAWSGVLLAHGVTNVALGLARPRAPKEDSDARLPFVLAPAQLGVYRAPGIVAIGVF
jgi:hypothetical protein